MTAPSLDTEVQATLASLDANGSRSSSAVHLHRSTGEGGAAEVKGQSWRLWLQVT